MRTTVNAWTQGRHWLPFFQVQIWDHLHNKDITSHKDFTSELQNNDARMKATDIKFQSYHFTEIDVRAVHIRSPYSPSL